MTRFPLLALAVLSLFLGLWAGLLRLGWPWPSPVVGLAASHGPVMVAGFLGTVITLERAVALRKGWCYLAPLAAGTGSLLWLTRISPMAGIGLIVASSLLLVVIFVVLLRRQNELFLHVMAAGAVSWFVANVFWMAGAPIFDVVYGWVGFLVLTIVGERIELSRMLMHGASVNRAVGGLSVILAVGIAVSMLAIGAGVHLTGVVLAAMAVWLFLHDISRHTVRMEGLTRFIAVCLLAGYAWLLTGGLLMAWHGRVLAGPVYDAMLHAVLVGFVFSMIFGHAPIIFPSVLGIRPFYSRIFYVHLVLLHGALLLRLCGDLEGFLALRRWGGLMNAVAILLFLVVTVTTAIRAHRAARVEALSAHQERFETTNLR